MTDLLKSVEAAANPNIPELRSGELELSQPQDGGWHFYASDAQADMAAKLASAWAQAFTTQVTLGIQTEVALDAARKALAANPGDAKLQSDINGLEAKSLSITPELQISPAQTKDLPVERKSGPGVYALAGAGLFLAVSALIILLAGKADRA